MDPRKNNPEYPAEPKTSNSFQEKWARDSSGRLFSKVEQKPSSSIAELSSVYKGSGGRMYRLVPHNPYAVQPIVSEGKSGIIYTMQSDREHTNDDPKSCSLKR